MQIKNSRFEIFEKGVDTLGLIVYSPRLAVKVNKYLNFPFAVGSRFTDGDEPQFSVPKDKAKDLLINVLKLDKDYVDGKIN